MSRDDNISYSGPPKEWKPSIGNNADVFRNRRKIREANYSNEDLLRRNLDILIAETTSNIIESERILKDFKASGAGGPQGLRHLFPE
jgi:hypothetical protein